MSSAGPDSPRDLPPEARAALDRGEIVVAIKIVREQWGLGLREAKDAVERFERRADPRAGPRSGANPPRDKLPLTAIVALQRGDKIAAIKAVRAAWQTDLKDSHDAVLAYVAADPALSAKVGAVAAEKRRRLLAWLAAIAVVAVAGIAWVAR